MRLSIIPLKPIFSSFLNNTSKLTTSKAFLKFTKTATTILLSSSALDTKFIKSTVALSVLLFFKKPYWNSSYKTYLFINESILFLIIFFNNFGKYTCYRYWSIVIHGISGSCLINRCNFINF